MRISECISDAAALFTENGIDTAHLDAEVLVAHALGMERFSLLTKQERELTSDEISRIKRVLRRRAAREPVAYITGSREFYSLDFCVNKHVLIPRPETELLVDMAIYYVRQNGTVLDVGTGSGAIAVSVQYCRPDAAVSASDISEPALKTARKNERNILGVKRVEFRKGNLFEPWVDRCFDVIVSNPPYVDPALTDTLEKELSYEPEIALYSEDRGRGIISEIVARAGSHLTGNGILLLEIGSDMKEYIQETGNKNGFTVSVLNDYSGLSRVAVLKKG